MKKSLSLLAALSLAAFFAPSGAFAAKADKVKRNKSAAASTDAAKTDAVANAEGATADGAKSDAAKADAATTASVDAAKADPVKADGAKARVIAKYDTNKNKKLDAEEFEGVRKDFDANPKGGLARLDTDHDGKLSDNEIVKLAGAAAKRGDLTDATRAEKKAKREKKKAKV